MSEYRDVRLDLSYLASMVCMVNNTLLPPAIFRIFETSQIPPRLDGIISLVSVDRIRTQYSHYVHVLSIFQNVRCIYSLQYQW